MVASIKQKLIPATTILLAVIAFSLQRIPIFDIANSESYTHFITNGFQPWYSVALSPTLEVWWLSSMLLVSAALCFGANINGIAKAAILTLITLSLFGGERLMLRAMLTTTAATYLLQYSRDKKLIILITLFTIWFVFGGTSFSTFSYPSYPSGARIVPDDGIAGLIRPLLGPDANMQIIDRHGLKEHYTPLALIVFLISLYPALKGYYLGALFALLALLDTLLPEAYSQIAPLQSLSRLVPYLLYMPLLPAILGLSLVFTLRGISNMFFVFLLGLYGLAISSTEFSCNLSSKAKSICEYQYPNSHILFTPSAYIALNIDRDILSRYYDLGLGKLVTEIPNLIPFRGSERLLDQRDSTRLRLNNRQLLIKFSEQQNLAGIVLNPGSFNSDFPRSFEVRDEATKKVLFKTNNWQGAIRFDEKSGLPYYGPEQDVTVLFAEKILTNGITITTNQQAQEPFDWSVAEFRIIKEG